MSNLQTIAFGAASDGSQGDTTRQGFTKDNANVAVLNAQATLTSFATTITTAQDFTQAHVGKRVNVNMATAGMAVGMPPAAAAGADSLISIRNIGTTPVDVWPGGGNPTAPSGPFTTLRAGETSVFDTDGTPWKILYRSRSTSPNETVNGNSTVVGNETIGGTLAVTGATTLGGTVTFPDLTVQQTAATRKNLFHNARFRVNTRGAAASYTSAAAYAYFLDRWRVTVSGQTVTTTATNGYYSTLTCPAGGVEQVIEPSEIFGGTYVVNWQGTATCEYGAAGSGTPIIKGGTVTLAPGAGFGLRFKGGTVWLPQLNPGNYSPAFDSPADPEELARCERYCRTVTIDTASYAGVNQGIEWSFSFPTMRAVPTNAGILSGTPGYAGITAPPTFQITANSLTCVTTAPGTAGTWYVVNYKTLLTADL